MADGTTSTTTQNMEEGHHMDESIGLDDNYEDICTPNRVAADLVQSVYCGKREACS